MLRGVGVEIWSATLTVGSSGDMLGFGAFDEGRTGSLSRSDFSWRGKTYRITNLFYNRAPRSADTWSVVVDVSPALPLEANEFGCLALRLGDLWLNLADGQGNGRQFFWYDIDLDWSNGDTTEVGLREFPPGFEARSIRGLGNNLLRPELGMAGTHLLRKAAVGFDFAMSASTADELPNARTISNLLHGQGEPTPNAAGATDMLWQWGQFLDHDISLTPSTITSSRAAITIPRGDPVFDPFNAGARLMDFVRSMFDPQTGTDPDNPREQVNLITAFIDASNVYGSSNSRAHALRANDGSGQLRTTSNGRFLPPNPPGLEIEDGGRPRSGLFFAGDIRVNEQVALTAMHTLFVREHNRLAELIASEQPELTGHEIYELARKIVGAQMQVITYQEFLPLLLGPGAIGPYTGYDSMVDPSIANEFSTAAFRVGHTMLSPSLMMIDAAGNTDTVSLAESFFNTSMVREEGIEVFLRGVSTQTAQEIDLALVDEIRNMLFGPPGSAGRDLAALNIQRGRDHGLPRYNIVRSAYGLTPATDFADISSDREIQRLLELAYEDVDEVDLWTAGLAEDHVPGAMVGETFHAIITDQFRRLRDGDRFWFENDPCFRSNPELLADVRSTTLADIIRRNTMIGDEIPDNVFGGPRPRIKVAAEAGSIEEGAPAEFRLIRSGPTSMPLSVVVDVSETGTMLAHRSGEQDLVTFKVGSGEARVVVSTSDDSNPEYGSTIRLAVREPEDDQVDVEAAAAEVTVIDNDSIEFQLNLGVNVIDWSGPDGVDVAAALAGNGGTDITTAVTAVYERDEAGQRWLAFSPSLEGNPELSGGNTLRVLRTGQRYVVEATQSVVWRIHTNGLQPAASGE